MIDISVTIEGRERVTARIAQLPDKARAVVVRNLQRSTLDVYNAAQHRVHGPVLKVRTGRLAQSINRRVKDEGDIIVGTVGINKRTVPYAEIHEFGGQTPPHVIRPVKAKALAFAQGGKTVFARQVNHPGSRMPERSYLRTSLADHREQFIARLRDELGRELDR